MLVSPHGAAARPIDAPFWLAHTWNARGDELYGITMTDELRLELVSLAIQSGRVTSISDLGPSPPVNNPIKGLSFNAERNALLIGLVQMRGDIWLLRGLEPPRGLLARLLSR